MNEIVWLSHGGPGSGRYPKGSGENPYQHVSWRKRRKIRKEASRRLESIKDKKENPKQNKEYESQEFDKKETVKSEAPSNTDFVKAATAARNAASGADTVSKGVDKAWNSLHNVKYANEDRAKNVRGLTNEELRKTIDRIKLDQEYNKITMPPKSKGYDRTMAALAVVGSVLTVTATGLSIAAGVQALRKK